MTELVAPHEEKKQIKDLVNNTKLKEGQEWFVVDFKWWQLWKSYVGYDDTTGSGGGDASSRPGPITNTDLLDAAEVAGTDSNRLRPGLVEEYDYVVIPKQAWTNLESWYGGGPKIMRRVVTVGMAQKCRVDLYPIELAWGKNATGGIFTPVGKVLVSRQSSFKELKRKIAGLNISPPHKTRLWIKDDDGDWECLDNPLLESKTMEEMGFEDGHVVMLELMSGDNEWPRNKLRSNRAGAGATTSTSVEMNELRNKGANRVADVESDFTGIGPRLPAGHSSAGTAANPANRTSYSYRTMASNTEGKVNPGLAGLTNLGNTCFMNSALQCLSNTVQLTNYFLSNEYLGDLNKTNPLGMKGLLAEHYGMMLKQIWSGKYKVVAPSRFKQVVGKFAPQFSGYAQQDSQELVAFLLDGLHEDLNKILQKPYVEGVEGNGRPDEVVADEAWAGHLKRNKSVIVDLFQGQFKSTVNCDVCEKMSVTFDPFMYLSVPLPVSNDRVMLITTVYLNKPPLIHAIKVPKLGDVSDIQKQLSKISGLTPEQMGICDVYSHKVFAALDPKKAIKNIRESDDIYCFEIIVAQPPAEVQESKDQTKEEGEVTEDSMDTDDAPTVPGQQAAAKEDKDKGKAAEVVKPTLEYIPVINRERKLTGTLSKSLTWNAVGFPFVLSFNPATTTHRQIYQMLMDLVKKVFNKEGVEEVETTPQPEKMEEERTPSVPVANDANATPKEEEGKGRGGFPFALSFGSGYSGTTNYQVPVDDQPLEKLPKIPGVAKPSLICDWSAEGLKKYYDEKVVSKHSSVSEISADQQRAIPLESCINLFTQQEKLSATDTWYCAQCKEHREALKKFDVWKLPRILVVHLKRFQFSRTWREKIETRIEFPVEGLDLTRYVKGPDSDKPQIYDLYGVSNHSGGMGFGHYTAYSKNHRENKWYKFNDTLVSDASEKDVVSKEAYLLFYERREDTTIKPVDFEYNDAEITETIAQIKKEKTLDDIDDDDGHAKKGSSSSSSSGYYTSTSSSSSSAGNSGVAGKELVLAGHPDPMSVDHQHSTAAPDYDDDAEEGLGLLRNLRRGGAGASSPVAGVGVPPGFVDPNSIPSALNPHPGVIPNANANPNAHYQPPM